jgi:hypothetical protein
MLVVSAMVTVARRPVPPSRKRRERPAILSWIAPLTRKRMRSTPPYFPAGEADEKANTLDARYVCNPDDGPEALPLRPVKATYVIAAVVVIAFAALVSGALIGGSSHGDTPHTDDVASGRQ